MEQVIDITAKREGFRRAGMAHSETTQTYPLSRFTAAQLALLKAEPMLIVVIRDKDDGAGKPSPQAELNAKVLELEGDIQILTRQQVDALAQVEELTEALATECETTTRLSAELDAERQQVAALTQQLDAAKAAAEKKGK